MNTRENTGLSSRPEHKPEIFHGEPLDVDRPTFSEVAEAESPRHEIPAHYDKAVSPWDLQRYMDSTGSAFVDARLCDVIEYAFRDKGDKLGDLKKARHCLDAAIKEMEGEE